MDKFLFAIIVLFFGNTIYRQVRSGNGRFILDVWDRFTVLRTLQTIMVLGLTLIVGVVLYTVPLLQWGWWRLLMSVTQASAPASPIAGTSSGYLAPVVAGLHGGGMVGLVLVALLGTVAFPGLAYREEQQYRGARNSWRATVPASVRFGLMHLIMGIPPAVAIALIVPGLFFGHCYMSRYWNGVIHKNETSREALVAGLLESTAAHATYNTVVVWTVVTVATVYPWSR